MPDRDLDLDALRAVAAAATPGPWEQRTSDRSGRPIVVEADAKIVGAYRWAPGDGATDPAWSDTAYIAAADPSTVLALIDRVKRAEAALRIISTFERQKPGGWFPTTEAEIARAALEPTEGEDA